jgi:hypothetical protein
MLDLSGAGPGPLESRRSEGAVNQKAQSTVNLRTPLHALLRVAKKRPLAVQEVCVNGAKETRTPDPLHAMQVLYQLSYGPVWCARVTRAW